MIISLDAEKYFDIIQYPFMINTLHKVSTEGTCLSIIKATYNRPTANIILNDETIPLRARTLLYFLKRENESGNNQEASKNFQHSFKLKFIFLIQPESKTLQYSMQLDEGETW